MKISHIFFSCLSSAILFPLSFTPSFLLVLLLNVFIVYQYPFNRSFSF